MSGEVRRRGAFILFEGADRCGKSTQCAKLVEYLTQKGLPVRKIGFPDRSSPTTGALLDAYLQGRTPVDAHVSHLMFSANRWEKAAEMKELLHSGHTVIVDRYAYSGIAYSVAKKSIPFAWACQADVGLPAPDVILYFSLSFDDMQRRPGFGDEIFDNREFQTTVQDIYSQMRKADPSPDTWRVIEANRAVDEIHQEIVSIANDVITKVAGKPLAELQAPIGVQQELI
ncbi:MAG: dTMP kinase [archaeon]|nr:dTMP kinase [archaeon]